MRDRVLQLRQARAASRRRLESLPAYGRSNPLLPSFLSDLARSRGYCVGLLVQIFSPERFQPAYWAQFGLPDLTSEFRDLDLSNRLTPLRAILTDEEFERFWKALYGVVSEWVAWREQFLATSGSQDGRLANGWTHWSDETLQRRWNKVMQSMDDLRQHLHQVAVLIGQRTAKSMDRRSAVGVRHAM